MKTGKQAMIVTAMMALLAAGCSQSSQPASTPQPTSVQSPVPQPASQQDEKMDEKAVVKLVAEGMKRYWHVMSGGEGAGGTSDGGPIPTFQVNGKEYRYLGKDIDTKEKLMDYLQASYTPEASDAFVKGAMIVEHEGRLGQPDADGGSLLQWENAQATLIKESGDVKEFELKVPFGEGADIQFEAVTVEVKKSKDGWRISTPAHEIR